MKIGSVELITPTVFAPLAGISNLPLRLLAKEAGCGLVCSEMVSACGLHHGSAKTEEMLHSDLREKPLSIQLFGSEAAVMADAARKVQDAGADIIDLNFGCSVRKVLKTGSGSALMREPDKAAGLIKAVREAVRIPMTVKMRSGWDKSGEQALKLAQIAQEYGADAVALHPRTANQGFGGQADWSLIGRLKQSLSIPVIGNGDIVRAEDALHMLNRTGCDAVMVGRAAIGNPLIFTQIADLLAGRPARGVSHRDRIALMIRFLESSVAFLGEKRGCRMMRSRLIWFAKGMPRAAQFRHAVRLVDSLIEARGIIDDYARSLADPTEAERA